MEALKKVLILAAVAFFFALPACQSNDEFTPLSTNDVFLQDYNPETLDILWVIDDRSPMYYAQAQLVKYATAFFTRLDAQARDYRMGFISSDMHAAQGRLKSKPITRNMGDTAQRVSAFQSVISKIINLQTGYTGQGLLAAVSSLNQYFVPRANVPLVLVFISYENDYSTLPPGQTDPVQYFTDKFVQIKGGNRDLVRAYAINFFDLPAGADAATTKKFRCIDDQVYEIDTQGGFVNNYFEIAQEFGGDIGNICAGELENDYADKIDLTGLRMKTLPSRFLLSKPVGADSNINVQVFNATQTFDIKWTVDRTKNELVFATTPPEGTTIRVIYLTN